MRGFETILVPLDFSDAGGRILRAALDVLAEGGRIELLHVVEWLPALTGGTFGIYAHRKDIEKIKALALEKLRDMARAHPDVRIGVAVKEGKPATVILEVVAEMRPDVVVMGSHGRSKLDHLLLGSVAERVLRKAPCAVLTVRF
jgi:nucleotide-binding universal stress UspA family protein